MINEILDALNLFNKFSDYLEILVYGESYIGVSTDLTGHCFFIDGLLNFFIMIAVRRFSLLG